MEPGAGEDLADPRAADDWLFDFRRRDVRAESPGIALDEVSIGVRPRGEPSGRVRGRDPLAECRECAAQWQAPPSAMAEEPDNVEQSLEPCN
jgi:hypothetical protein